MKLKALNAAILSSLLLVGCAGEDDTETKIEYRDAAYATPTTTELTSVVNTATYAAATAYNHDDDKLRMVLKNNAALAYAMYSDAYNAAVDLQTAVNAFNDAATATGATAGDAAVIKAFKTAKLAWLTSREAYGETEVYRFRNSPIDDDYSTTAEEDGPEGSLNAWPLGEALIDYVTTGSDFGDDEVGVSAHSTDVNGGAAVTGDAITAANNIIATTAITIDSSLLANTATADDEHDVISGYHAIEFLLWGQDLNGSMGVTDGTDREDAVKAKPADGVSHDMLAKGGMRKPADFMTATNADRRRTYLKVATDLLVDELEGVRDAWKLAADGGDASNYVNDYFLKNIDTMSTADMKTRLDEIIYAMGTLSQGELAGERMQIALANNSQEDEHSCFSDNTHRDIVLNAEGVRNMYTGDYDGYYSYSVGSNGTPITKFVATNAVAGYGIDDYLKDTGEEDVATRIQKMLDITQENYMAIDEKATLEGKPFDVLIQNPASEDAEPVRNTILMLTAQAVELKNMATMMDAGDGYDAEGTACDTTDPTSTCEE